MVPAQSGPKVLQLEISVTGPCKHTIDSMSTSLDFHVVHEPILIAVKPSFGVSWGGSVVTVQGRHFITSYGSPIDCVFGEITKVEGVVVSSEEVLCVSPSHKEGVVSLALDVRGSGAILSSSLKFMYDPPLLATSLLPQRGVSGETLAITVAGEGFASGRSDRKSTRLNSSHSQQSRMPSSA